MRTKEEVIESQIYTNDDFTLHERFKDIIERSNEPRLCLYSLVGYFRASGYFALAESLKGLKKVRIIVGINADEMSVNWYKTAKEKRDRIVREAAYREICAGIDAEGFRPAVARGLKSFVDDVLTGRTEIRAIAGRVVHAKFYLFMREDWRKGDFGRIITGSSNFTASGLGVFEDEAARNYELNIEREDQAALSFTYSEFKRLWEESVELVPTEIETAVTEKAFLGKAIKPNDFYYRFLYEVFKETVNYEGSGVDSFFPTGFKRLSYQIDAVNEGLGMLERHSGFFLADVVGLGKTVVTTIMLLRWFSLQDKLARALVVAPPVLIKNWKDTFDSFQIPEKKYCIVSSGSLHKVADPASYAIIIVDEAHNFRNEATEAYRRLEGICKLAGELGTKKVVLVSATPLNNKPREIRNLLNLFQNIRASTLSVSDLFAYFQEKERAYDEAKKQGVDAETARVAVKTIYRDIRERVLQDVTIRRTRSDLVENELYRKDLQNQGIRFPDVQKPRSIGYYLDSDVDQLFDDTLDALTIRLHYAFHKRLSYLSGSAREKFTFTEHTFEQLSGLLRRFFMKRLDSSFEAFKKSLARFKTDTEALLSMYRDGAIYYSNSVSVTEFVGNDDIEGLIAQLEERRAGDPSITVFAPSDFSLDFEKHLVSDRETLTSLLERWNSVSDDPKFDEFGAKLDTWLRESANPGRRLVVFSESEDTVRMIGRRLAEQGRTDVLAVSAENRDDEEIAIRRNFDANFPSQLMEDRYRILIATDVLAEGVNLHRANTVVNYDTPWNSVRLFQRVGRVNRVGSVADKVYIYNFFPLPRVDDQIELKKKAEMKLQAFHSAFGEDAPIYSPVEEVEHFGLYGGAGMEDEGASPKVKLLMEIRSLMESDPERFERIVKLPGGLCCLRSGSQKCFVFLATARKDLFYRDEGGGLVAISLAEAAELIRADETERAKAGDHDWEALIAAANGVYLDAEEGKKQEETRAKHFANADKKALRMLESYFDRLDADFFGLGAERAETFRRAAQIIRSGGATRNLVRTLNEIEKNSVNVAEEALARHIAETLAKFSVDTTDIPQARTPRDLRSTIEPARFVMAEAWK